MVLSKGCYIKSGHSVADRAPVIPMKVAQFWKWNESFHGWGYDAQKEMFQLFYRCFLHDESL